MFEVTTKSISLEFQKIKPARNSISWSRQKPGQIF